jgi:CRP-like cAMP-binding protein
MIDGKPRSATVTVTAPTRTLAIPHQVFEELTAEEPEFRRGLLKLLCARLRQTDAVC